MNSLATLSVVFLALSSAALAKFSVPIKKIQGPGAYLKGAPHVGRAHAEFLTSSTSSHSSVSPISAFVTNIGVGYTASIGIGNPPTYYDLVIDTTVANTWCGGTSIRPYVPTSSSRRTDQEVTIPYISGSMKGVEYDDTVTLASGLVITNQSIGVAFDSPNGTYTDGTIGFGPKGLSKGTLSPDKNAIVSTVMTTLVSEGIIEEDILGIFFAPPEYTGEQNGFLTYGGVDSSLYLGTMMYVPLTTTTLASNYWGIDVQACTYGYHILFLVSTAAIVDSSASLIYLADNFFEVYLQAIPGAQLDSETGLIEIPDSSLELMQPLNFEIGDQEFTLDVNAQLVPRDQNIAWGGVEWKNYGLIGPLKRNSGKGPADILFGLPFMQRFYTVLDAGNKRVGFAKTTYS